MCGKGLYRSGLLCVVKGYRSGPVCAKGLYRSRLLCVVKGSLGLHYCVW